MLSLQQYESSDASDGSSSPASSSDSSSGSDSEVKSTPTEVKKKGKKAASATVSSESSDASKLKEDDLPDHLKPLPSSSSGISVASQMQVVAAPDVVVNVSSTY